MSVLAVIEHDRGTITSASLGVLTAARTLATQMGTSLEAVTVGTNADALASVAAQYGATVVHQAHHAALTDFGPEAWGEAVAGPESGWRRARPLLQQKVEANLKLRRVGRVCRLRNQFGRCWGIVGIDRRTRRGWPTLSSRWPRPAASGGSSAG